MGLVNLKIVVRIELSFCFSDMIKYMEARDPNKHQSSASANIGTGNLFNLRHKQLKHGSSGETTFNLYAVSCHHGNMHGGHYTGSSHFTSIDFNFHVSLLIQLTVKILLTIAGICTMITRWFL